MTILGCAGEDVDFQDNTTFIAGGRTGYARGYVSSPTVSCARSFAFPGGAVTTGWFCCRNPLIGTNKVFAGLGSIAAARGLLVGTGAASTKAGLYKSDGATTTLLASESGTSLIANSHVDMNVKALGSSGAVDVYVDNNLVIAYTGDLSWLTSMDCFMVGGSGGSELIVADEDTRLFSLVTQAPNAAGDSNVWTGAYTDISDNTINDATVLYTNTTGQDALFNLIDLPSGTFGIKAVRIAARVAKSSGATAGSISLGVKSGGTVNIDSAHACGTAFTTIDRLMTQNPVTSAAWAQGDMNGLQVAFRSAA